MDVRQAEPVRRTGRATAVALRLALGTASALGLARFAFGLLVPAMREDLRWTLAQAGAQTTANGLGYLAGAVLTPVVVRRMGPARAFRLGMVVVAASLGASAADGGFTFLLIMRASAGLAGAVVFIAGGVIVSRLAGSTGSATPITIYFAGAGMAIAACGAALPPLLSGHANRWPEAWAALAVAAVAATAVSWTAVRGEPPGPESAAAAGIDLGAVRRLWPVAAAYLLFGAGYIAYITFLSAYLTGHRASAAQTAVTWALLGLAAVAAPGLWSRPIGAWRGTLALGTLLALLAAASVLALADPAAPAVAGSALLYGVTFLCVPAAVTALIRSAVPRAGWTSALAAFTILFAAGQTAGPYLAGALADHYGSGATLAWTAALCAAGALAAMLRTGSARRPG